MGRPRVHAPDSSSWRRDKQTRGRDRGPWLCSIFCSCSSRPPFSPLHLLAVVPFPMLLASVRHPSAFTRSSLNVRKYSPPLPSLSRSVRVSHSIPDILRSVLLLPWYRSRWSFHQGAYVYGVPCISICSLNDSLCGSVSLVAPSITVPLFRSCALDVSAPQPFHACLAITLSIPPHPLHSALTSPPVQASLIFEHLVVRCHSPCVVFAPEAQWTSFTSCVGAYRC